MKNIILIIFIIVITIIFSFFILKSPSITSSLKITKQPTPTPIENPLSINRMRNTSYPGSDLVIEQTLEPGTNYNKYIASYQSDGLKIYGLLTVPQENMVQKKPSKGWPVIIFNHGYIPPNEYKTTERYVAYVDGFARNGYIVFKSDYRGHDKSEGQALGAYYSNAYTTDVLNALFSLKKYKDSDPNNIGMWGHSMGGNITLRSIVVKPKDIKAAVIWGGVVGSYDEIMNKRRRAVPFQPPPIQLTQRNNYRATLINLYGTPEKNPSFWNSIDPTAYIKDILTPVQIDHGEDDEEVPLLFATSLKDRLEKNKKIVEYYVYPGNDHNISQSFNLAMERSIQFFDTYLKAH